MKTRIKIHSDIYEIMIGNSHLSNGVNNIPINAGANTVMNQVRNNQMTRLANIGQLKIKNE